MEIEMVAECNRVDPYEQHGVNSSYEQTTMTSSDRYETSGSVMGDYERVSWLSNDHHKEIDADLVTKSLLAISEKSCQWAFGHKTGINQLGPWFFDEKWLPRKRPNHISRGKRFSKKRESPSKFHSPSRSYPARRRLSTKNEHGKCPDIKEQTTLAGEKGNCRKDDVELIRWHLRPTTVPASRQDEREDKNGVSAVPDASNFELDHTTSIAYPTHSLPTLITLRSGHSAKNHDAVYSLGKSTLSSKDLIISMGQHPKNSTTDTRQVKSATSAGILSFKRDKLSVLTPTQAFERDSRDSMEEMAPPQNGHSRAVMPQEKSTTRPDPPSCEHADISLHIRHYRMYHTVRLTGRFSLANDPPQIPEIKPVQWDDVFPNRPLISTTPNTTTVPVFRYSVSDFQKEQLVEPSVTVHEETDSASKSSPARTLTHKSTAGRIHRKPPKTTPTIAMGLSCRHESILAKSRNNKRDVTLSPIVTPVAQNRKESLTPKDVENVTKPEADWQENNVTDGYDGIDNRPKLISQNAGYGFENIDTKSTSREYCCAGVNPEKDESSKTDTSEKKPLTHIDTVKEIRAVDGNKTSGNGIMKEQDHKAKETLVPNEERQNISHGDESKLPKTQNGVNPAYTVYAYNDTFQNLTSDTSNHGTDYREYLKRSRKYGNKTFSYLSHENAHALSETADLDPAEADTFRHTWSTSKSNKKTTNILQDVIGLPRFRSDAKTFELTRYDSPWRRSVKTQKNSESVREMDALERMQVMEEGARQKSERPNLKIDAHQLHESVVRKICQGNKFMFTTKSFVENNNRCMGFLVEDDRDKKTPPFFQPRRIMLSQTKGTCEISMRDWTMAENDVQSIHRSDDLTGNSADRETNLDDSSHDASPNDTREKCTKRLDGKTPYGQSGSCLPCSEYQKSGFPRTRNVWRPGDSQWRRKTLDSRPMSSPFHYRPTSSSASAYIIAMPPMQKTFDDKNIVLPLEDFVQMAMKSRKSSFSAWSQSVNAGSKLGIAPNSKGRVGTYRKSADDGLVRVVSFASPVNQFIFAKRIIGLSPASSLYASSSNHVAKEAGRDVFQRKISGAFRLRLDDVGHSDPKKKSNPPTESATSSTNDSNKDLTVAKSFLGKIEINSKKEASTQLGENIINEDARKTLNQDQDLLEARQNDDYSLGKEKVPGVPHTGDNIVSSLNLEKNTHARLRNKVVNLVGLRDNDLNLKSFEAKTNSFDKMSQNEDATEFGKDSANASNLLKKFIQHKKQRKESLRNSSFQRRDAIRNSLVTKTRIITLKPDNDATSSVKDLTHSRISTQRVKTVRFSCDEPKSSSSAYNPVERRMAPMSKMTAGIILPSDSFGSHLNASNKTIDSVLEKRNFEAAGQILSEVFNETDTLEVDGHPFT